MFEDFLMDSSAHHASSSGRYAVPHTAPVLYDRAILPVQVISFSWRNLRPVEHSGFLKISAEPCIPHTINYIPVFYPVLVKTLKKERISKTTPR